MFVYFFKGKYFTFQTNIPYMFKPLHQRRHSSSPTSTGSGSEAPFSLFQTGWFTGGPPGTTMASKGNYATLYTTVNVIKYVDHIIFYLLLLYFIW